MSIKAVKLSYQLDALEPIISERAMACHYEKHYLQYIDKLNYLIRGTPFNKMSLELIVRKSHTNKDKSAIFNNAAQAWNHEFLWNCLSPKRNSFPSFEFEEKISQSFGTYSEFQEQFKAAAMKHFGSGYLWLVKGRYDELFILSTENSENPLASGQIPLLTCDLWEHAYYLDYQNDRNTYLTGFCENINWNFVQQNFSQVENELFESPKNSLHESTSLHF